MHGLFMSSANSGSEGNKDSSKGSDKLIFNSPKTEKPLRASSAYPASRGSNLGAANQGSEKK